MRQFHRQAMTWNVQEEGRVHPVHVLLEYDTGDPHVVRATFVDGAETLIWEFARVLLKDGVEGSAGIGDIKIEPCSDHEVSVRLETPEGVGVMEANRNGLRRFVAAIYKLVPEGSEDMTAAVNAMLGRLLPGGVS